MELSGERTIPAPRETVWRALNDPEILRQSIPGCESVEKESDTEMTARVTAKVGPVKAKFTGKVVLSDLNPPESYRISGEGKGGAAGFAKGGATVRLAEQGPSETLLTYDVDAQVGGKLAQLGGRLIDGTARRMAEEFFTNFTQIVSGPPTAEPATAEPATAEPAPAPESAPADTATEDAAAAAAVSRGAPVPPSEPPAAPAPAGPSTGLPLWLWVALLVIFVVVLVLFFL